MAFYAAQFTFAGESGANYSLRISSGGTGGDTSSNLPGDVKLYTEKLFRRTDEYLYGTDIQPMLEFPAIFTVENPESELTAIDLQGIGNWLFGRRNYQELYIMQPDMGNVMYSCFLLQPKIMRTGNIIRGVECIVHCKDAWGLSDTKSITYTGAGTFNHANLSDDSGYLYPQTVITVDSFGGDITITNTSDNNRQFVFTGLQANEVITIDNSLQSISSSTTLRRMSNFNKKFFRLVNGENVLNISGNIASLNISYREARKIGG